MNLSKNTVLITGGASGIGFALAQRLSHLGNHVVICGRRKEQLEIAKSVCPELDTIQCDVSKESDRVSLFERVTKEYPKLNILINNAGIQNRLAPLTEPQNWQSHRLELATNVEAPMHLSHLFISHLKSQASPAIVNVSSGLAFSPISFMATYCATKAALHSFTLSLRHQLRNTGISVIEIIPPSVNTDLGGKGLHDDGAPLDAFADHVMTKLAEGSLEFGYGFSEKSRLASRADIDQLFANMNRN